MKLGVDIYSIRSQGWDVFEVLEYCAGIGLNVVHFSDLGPFSRTDDAYLRSVKARADELGLSLEVGMLSICPTSGRFDASRGDAVTQTREMLHIATMLGSPVLRCVLGSADDRVGALSLADHMQATIDTCRAVRAEVLDRGLKLAIENHAGDMQGRELAELIERAGPEYVGACIDSGNPVWVAEDPMVTLEHLAPYIVASHIRDSAVWSHPRGAAVQWVAMGDGNVGIDAWAAELQKRCPTVPFTLEIITGNPPKVLNYMEPDYWETYPQALASEFARFERLVRQGSPYVGTMVAVQRGEAVPAEYQAALVAQQRYDLERSVRYCRETLGLGE